VKEWKTVILLTLAAFGFRILHFVVFANELVVGGDQMQNITLARRFASADFYGVLDVYWTPLYPILIGIVSFFSHSLTLPSVIISVLAGSLAVLFTYFLVKQSYGQREATIAAAIAVFYPHLINSVFGIGTENVYFLWMTAALFIGWRGLKNNSAGDFLMTGILLGLAYLTRPEAFGYLVFFVSIAIGKTLFGGKLSARNSTVPIAALLLGFIILAAPYLFYLRSATGIWTISGKVANNVAAGALQDNEESDAPDVAANSEKQTGKILVRAVVLNLIEIQKIFNYLFPILLMIFVALGLFGEQWDKERLKRESYLIAFCLITVFGYALAVSQVRYFYILLPIFFGWMACGIVQLERWLNKSMQEWFPNRFFYLISSKSFVILCIIFIYLYVLPVNFYMRPTEKAWRDAAFEERDAGLWLKKNGKPSPVIFSAGFRPVFYAEGKQIMPVTTDVSEVLAQIKQSQPDYIIIGNRSLKRHPYLKNLAEILVNSPEFERIYQNNGQPEYQISIFARK
jgi:4-amino-4-deoxy-L-arabinose transferase-like glycosyltransferase